MQNNILELSKELIKIKSIPTNPDGLLQSLKTAIKPLKGFTVEWFEHNGIKSVLVYNSKKRPKKFRIILNGHLDVVPGKDFQYDPVVKNDRLYGVGSMDMKASVACLVYVFKEVVSQVDYPLGLQLVTDEEIGGFEGTKHQVEQGVRSNFVIAGESTGFDIVNRAKGVMWTKVTSKGSSAHGAYPWNGDNAIWKMHTFLYKLSKKFPIPKKEEWITTVNLSRIESSNQSVNKVPDDCVAWLDVRYVPQDADSIEKTIKNLVPSDFVVEILTKEPALYTEEKNQCLKQLIQSDSKITKKDVRLYGANGTSDARHFQRVGNSGVEFGPLGGEIGSDNEWVSIKSLDTYCKILKDFLLSL